MFAIEFQAKIKNGVIEIPAEYWQQLDREKRVKVILLADGSQRDRQPDLIDRLLASPLKVDGFTPLQWEEI